MGNNGGVLEGTHGVVQNFGSVQAVLFLEVSLTENWLIFITRGYGTWPSILLVAAIFGVDVLATMFTLFGWLSGAPARGDLAPHGGWTDIVTVVRVYGYLNAIPKLANLGRRETGKKHSQWEDFTTALTRLTVIHETGEDNQDLYRFEDRVAL